MEKLERIIFVGRSGNCRELMAMGILQDCVLKFPVEVLARGLIVSFPEPINQKAEAVLISNGIILKNFSSVKLSNEDITENTLILTMTKSQREKVLNQYENTHIENVYVLTEFVGDELEILDPYGGGLPAYGLCYETLRKSIKKLVKMLNKGE
ncbi:MAG: phosphotyrosine protein phosphatase [Lachnospiraceae bacterium]|nr:phosphotyrosine protein phosphatase [Lachnospiraceae bacterium]